MKSKQKGDENRRHLSLSWKIILLTMLPFLLVLAAISVLTVQNKTQNEKDLVLNRIESFVNLLESGDLSFESVREKEKLEKMFNEKVISAQLMGRGRNVVYTTGAQEHEINQELIEKAFEGFTVNYTRQNKTPALISLYPIVVKDIIVGVLYLELSFDKSNDRIRQYTMFILLLNTSGLVILFLLVRFLSRKIIINRLEELTDLSSEIGKGNLQRRLDIRSDDELGTLALTFNDMTHQLSQTMESLQAEVAERKRAEEKLRRTVTDLEHSNAELQQFAYVASHDLQEPLRMVSSYVQLLARRYKGKLDSDADDFIAFAVDGALRMQTLINDLLTFSRVGTRGKPFEPTDCEAVLGHVLANLKLAIEESGAVITHDALPTVMADSSQLVQLIQNLTDNAIKFRGKETPHVHISATRESEIGDHESKSTNHELQTTNYKAWIFSIRDNGIGIDPEFFDRIFTIFQRLHNREEYPGTGIGLAVCKKIVERHGGRIWVESEPGKGTTFFFTIPDRGS